MGYMWAWLALIMTCEVWVLSFKLGSPWESERPIWVGGARTQGGRDEIAVARVTAAYTCRRTGESEVWVSRDTKHKFFNFF